MQEKPKPTNLRLDQLIPPSTDRVFFENYEKHPFRFDSEKFEMVNAWWLAEASLLAYDDEQRAIGKFRQAGFECVKLFSGRSTQCFVASNKSFAIVAFRGTQVLKLRHKSGLQEMLADMLADSRIALADSHQGGCVHRGFMDAIDEVWRDVDGKTGLGSYLDGLKSGDGESPTLWLTGHSLGAALATLAADRYGDVQGVYTFGSPRVGDEEFATDYHVNTFRFVNNHDMVAGVPLGGRYESPRLSPAGTYHHVGRLMHIDDGGRISEGPKLDARLKDRFIGNFGHMFNALGGIRSGHLRSISIGGLVDHSPVLYANLIWNSYLADRSRSMI